MHFTSRKMAPGSRAANDTNLTISDDAWENNAPRTVFEFIVAQRR